MLRSGISAATPAAPRAGGRKDVRRDIARCRGADSPAVTPESTRPDPSFWGYLLRRFMPSTRRLLTLGGAAVVGLAVTALFAAPASATTASVTGTSVCETNGTYTITLKITDVKVTPDTPLTPDLNGKKIKGQPAYVEATQTVPGTTTKAELSFHPVWSNGHRVDRYKGSVTLKGKCKPEGSPSPSTSARPSSSASPKPSESGGAGSPTPSSSTPALPVTGAQTAAYAGGSLLLLGAGAGLFFIARRRRIKFEA